MTEETKAQEVEEQAVNTNAEAVEEQVVEEQAVETSATAVEEQATEDISQEDVADVVVLKVGDSVKGIIVKVEDHQAFIDVGYKYDGVIPIRELSSLHLENAAESVQVGQEVECKVHSIDDDQAVLVLSKRAVDGEKAWDVLQAHFESRETFEAIVADVVKGGLVVDVGVRGFIPASMVERHYVEDFTDYKGRTLRLKVKELDRENNKVILSQKEVLDEEFGIKKLEILSSLTVNQELEGKVQRLTPFGVFVDIGGIDGLVHISEMAWTHIEKPGDLVQEGQTVKVKVLKVDPQNERISLSMKETQAGPWELLNDQFKVGEIVSGTVKRLVDFGAFVEIAPGVEGLVHISQISHSHIGTPHEVLNENQEIQVKILDINLADKRVSLSIKETEDAPVTSQKSDRGRGGGGGGNYNAREVLDNENVSLNSTGLSLTLGERFGDKLNKFK